MLDYTTYLSNLKRVSIFGITCPHCGAITKSASGKIAFCNFCEQYVNITEAGVLKENGAEIAFAEVNEAMSSNRYGDAEKKVASLIEGTRNPELLYLSALFYMYFSDAKYHERDYNLRGFMEPNADNVRAGLDLTSKWKECFYKAIKLIKSDLDWNVMIDQSLLFIKFMSEVKLRRFVDAERTLKALHGRTVQSVLADYADMVYHVEANRIGAEASVVRMLVKGDMNSFCYLAKHLANQKKLDEAEKVVKWLNGMMDMFMAQELERMIESAQEASRM